jgi:hypothetical protein
VNAGKYTEQLDKLLTELIHKDSISPAKRNLLPPGPGIYLFSDHEGNYIYIGMTDRGLRTRVTEHFYETKKVTSSQWIQRYLVAESIVNGEGRAASRAAKTYMEANYVIRFLEIGNQRERVCLEQYSFAVLQPRANVYQLQDPKTPPSE